MGKHEQGNCEIWGKNHRVLEDDGGIGFFVGEVQQGWHWKEHWEACPQEGGYTNEMPKNKEFMGYLSICDQIAHDYSTETEEKIR